MIIVGQHQNRKLCTAFKGSSANYFDYFSELSNMYFVAWTNICILFNRFSPVPMIDRNDRIY